MLTLQRLIAELCAFWESEGCLIEQPYDNPVGAGTMHPATFLRVLGPEPWRCAYVQPSRRPADGRYGQNPFRLAKHLQLQVVLKPSPEDVQEVFLRSLERLGISAADHDIRFEEDNWESPTLGAWGVADHMVESRRRASAPIRWALSTFRFTIAAAAITAAIASGYAWIGRLMGVFIL